MMQLSGDLSSSASTISSPVSLPTGRSTGLGLTVLITFCAVGVCQDWLSHDQAASEEEDGHRTVTHRRIPSVLWLTLASRLACALLGRARMACAQQPHSSLKSPDSLEDPSASNPIAFDWSLHLRYGVLGLLLWLTNASAAVSLYSVSYSTLTLVKSAKLLPTIGVARCLGHTVARREWIAAAMLCVAIACLQVAHTQLHEQATAVPGTALETTHPPDRWETTNPTIGMTLLLLSLVCDAWIGPMQSQLLSLHGGSHAPVLAYSNAYACLLALVSCLVFASFEDWITWLRADLRHPVGMLVFSACSCAGAELLLRLIDQAGVFVAAFVLHARKVASISLSLLLFAQPWTWYYLPASALVAASLVIQADHAATSALLRCITQRSSSLRSGRLLPLLLHRRSSLVALSLLAMTLLFVQHEAVSDVMNHHLRGEGVPLHEDDAQVLDAFIVSSSSHAFSQARANLDRCFPGLFSFEHVYPIGADDPRMQLTENLDPLTGEQIAPKESAAYNPRFSSLTLTKRDIFERIGAGGRARGPYAITATRTTTQDTFAFVFEDDVNCIDPLWYPNHHRRPQLDAQNRTATLVSSVASQLHSIGLSSIPTLNQTAIYSYSHLVRTMVRDPAVRANGIIYLGGMVDYNGHAIKPRLLIQLNQTSRRMSHANGIDWRGVPLHNLTRHFDLPVRLVDSSSSTATSATPNSNFTLHVVAQRGSFLNGHAYGFARWRAATIWSTLSQYSLQHFMNWLIDQSLLTWQRKSRTYPFMIGANFHDPPLGWRPHSRSQRDIGLVYQDRTRAKHKRLADTKQLGEK